MSRKSVCFSLVLVLICGVALVVPASAQHFQHVTGSLTQVAAGRAEIWGLNAHLPYRFNPATKAFARVSTPTGFTQIAVGGGTPLQSDQVWALDGTGHTFQFNFGTKAFVNVPGPFANRGRRNVIPMKFGESPLIRRSGDITTATYSGSRFKARILSQLSRLAEAMFGGSMNLLRSGTTTLSGSGGYKLQRAVSLVPCNRSQLA